MNTELFDKRCKNIIDATNFVEPEKVPVGLDYMTWAYAIGGKTLEDVIDDPEENIKEFTKIFDEIEFDFSSNLGTYIPYDAYQALDSTGYSLCADKCSVQHNQASSKFMSEEEYQILIDDPGYFMNEYFIKKNAAIFKLPREEAYAKLKEGAKLIAKNVYVTNEIERIGIQEHCIVPLLKFGPPAKQPLGEYYGIFSPSYYATIDNLFDTYRGMMGVFEDLAENMETLDKACEAISNFNEKTMPKFPPQADTRPLPFGGCLYHVAGFLSPELYDKYWFNDFKKTVMPYIEAGKKINIKGEASFIHTIERFKDMPKGSIVIALDSDDPFEAYEKIGGYQTLMMGIKTAMLSTCDLQTCKDYIKKSFDTFAPGGGFMFYMDKPLFSPWDAPVEKVKELWHFANEYSYGKS